jgi:hypothetical protein
MGTYHLGAQPPRWVRRRAQDGQLGAGYVHRISAGPPYPLPLPPYLRAHSSKRLTQDLFSGHSDGYLSEMFGMTQMNMNSLIKSY